MLIVFLSAIICYVGFICVAIEKVGATIRVKDRKLLIRSGWIENGRLCIGISFRLRSSSLGLRPSGCDPTRRRDKLAQHLEASIKRNQ